MEMIIVYTYICGDILHKGHIEYLKNARSLGHRLIVGVLTDEAIMEKKTKPAMQFDERFDLVRSLEWVDVAVAQHTYSPLDNVKTIKPDILIESTDHKEQLANEFMESIGGRVVIFPYYPNHSSTKVKNKIKENNE
jgi:rfaE bifunctional protein nucleotidyltransferase chain/domain